MNVSLDGWCISAQLKGLSSAMTVWVHFSEHHGPSISILVAYQYIVIRLAMFNESVDDIRTLSTKEHNTISYIGLTRHHMHNYD